jgi:HDIG domain-containing protein
MSDNFNRDSAWELVKKYNEEPFHLHHAVTVEGVMRYYAEKHGYDPDFWGLAGLLHDVDFEKWPEEHCKKAPELLAEINTPEELVHAVCSHGYGICVDVEPTHEMENFYLLQMSSQVLSAQRLYSDRLAAARIWMLSRLRRNSRTRSLQQAAIEM